MLFLIYVDDMKNCSDIFNFILSADDTNLFITGKNDNSVVELANVELPKLFGSKPINFR